VVVFTRRVAESGQFTEIALELCERLAADPHVHVRKGVGWASSG
jgi:3-methyladenine DNA glycosylase AlkD